MSIRLILVDDHPIILQGLQRLFEREPQFEVIRSCSGGQEALAAVRSNSPDVLVLDLKVQDLYGFDVLRTLKAEHRHCRAVILTAAMRDDEVAEALELGVAGIVLKESPPGALVECVRAVHQGKRSIATRSTGRQAERGSGRPSASPAPRS